ncbi:MAG: tRNA glutamyl-Q(34) synthetase GluQRS [Myxococcales bacterium]|nr:tRNA glutamyl-Q(34) synthetase GluQRS [Myxococcales bacterium]
MPARPALDRGAGRFAPTPTGNLHLGNARTALIAWLAARKAGLRNVLRVEDLDPASMPEGCLEGQLADLDWLGLVYDEEPRCGGPAGPYRQSERSDQYAAVLRALDALGLLYPCWCSRREVQQATRAPHASDEGPVYAGTCKPKRPASLGDLDALPTRRGRVPALRFDVTAALDRLGATRLEFTDRLAGPQRFDLRGAMGDFVVRRVDGIAAYQIACSWDDVAMACTQVVRGADLLPSTARQLALLRTLGLPEPEYAHVGLVLDAAGNRLAKRDKAIALTDLRAAEVPAAAVVARLAQLSGLPATGALPALLDAFDLDRVPPGEVRLPPEA